MVVRGTKQRRRELQAMKTDKQLRRLCVNHWKRMLKLTVDDIRNEKEYPNQENCAFCRVYINPKPEFDDMRPACHGCPIYKKTGKKACRETPYVSATVLYLEIRNREHRRLSEFRKAVQKEIDFLEALEV